MRRALFIHGGALGDFVLGLRIVQCMRENGWESVDLLTRGNHLRLLPYLKNAGRGLDLDRGGFHGLFASDLSVIEQHLPMLLSYSLVVSMLPSPPLGLILSRTQTQYVEIDPIPDHASEVHITEQWITSLPEDWHIPDFHQPMLFVEDREKLIDTSVVRSVAIHPGSGSKRKCYPLVRFLEIANQLTAASLCPVFILGEVERDLFSRAEIDAIRTKFPVVENLPVDDLAHLLQAARAYLGNDSGVTHLAAAIGMPTIAIFGPTDPRRWRPLGPRVKVLACSQDESSANGWPASDNILELLRTILISC